MVKVLSHIPDLRGLFSRIQDLLLWIPFSMQIMRACYKLVNGEDVMYSSLVVLPKSAASANS